MGAVKYFLKEQLKVRKDNVLPTLSVNNKPVSQKDI